MDSAIHQINHYIQWISIRETNCVIHWIEIYPLDNSTKPTIEQLGPGASYTFVHSFLFYSQGVFCKPLLLAARGGHKEMVEFLLVNGASPTEEDSVRLISSYMK